LISNRPELITFNAKKNIQENFLKTSSSVTFTWIGPYQLKLHYNLNRKHLASIKKNSFIRDLICKQLSSFDKFSPSALIMNPTNSLRQLMIFEMDKNYLFHAFPLNCTSNIFWEFFLFSKKKQFNNLIVKLYFVLIFVSTKHNLRLYIRILKSFPNFDLCSFQFIVSKF
jgi:hypothetical protein